MTAKLFISIAAQVLFVLGLASAIFGLALWSRPLAYVVGGVVLSAVAFLVNYRNDDSGSTR